MIGKYKYLIGIIIIVLLYLNFRNVRYEKEIDLSLGYSELVISSTDRPMTSSCNLTFTGYSDCDITIVIPSSQSINLGAGEIKLVKKIDWYDEKRILKIISKSCSAKSKLTIEYSFN